jgi:hypothetical protein
LGADPAGLALFAVTEIGELQLAGDAARGGMQGGVMILRLGYTFRCACQVSAAWAVRNQVRSPSFPESCSLGAGM